MKRIIREDILKIQAYQPGKPIDEVKRESGLKDVIKLASNENALGPSPKAVKAISKSLTHLHRYPEGSCFYLKKALARHLNIKESNLLFGNGSDELIDIILKTIKEPDTEIITADTTFIEYEICGTVNGFRIARVPLDNFKFDLNAILLAVTEKTKVIFIANPNNPTGTYVNQNEVFSFLENLPKSVLVVFDEAYFEYVDEKDFPRLIPLIQKNTNMIILRTFSKIYGLAGLRIGYMIANDAFIEAAQRVKQPFNVNSLAQIAAFHALGDRVFIQKAKNLVKKEKQFLYKELTDLGLSFQPSSANFIFVKMNYDAVMVFKKLLKKGIIIRHMEQYKLDRYCRITIGTRNENKKLIQALKKILGETKQ